MGSRIHFFTVVSEPSTFLPKSKIDFSTIIRSACCSESALSLPRHREKVFGVTSRTPATSFTERSKSAASSFTTWRGFMLEEATQELAAEPREVFFSALILDFDLILGMDHLSFP